MRLIDADALIKEAMKSSNYFIIKYAVQKAPTVDAVPVVRCKDCKWRNTIGCDAFVAAQSVYACEDEGFCKWAERKEDD